LEQWLHHFPPNRRAAFAAALRRMHTRPRSFQALSSFTAMVKTEFSAAGGYHVAGDRRCGEWCHCGPDHPTPTNPRVILSPADEAHLVLGPWLRVLTGLLHKIFHLDNWCFYAGGATPTELDTWLQRTLAERPDHCAFEVDFSSFDSTLGRCALGLVDRWCQRLGVPRAGVVGRLLQEWWTPRGWSRQGWRFKGPVMNASGVDHTALRNGLCNMTAIGYVLASIAGGTDSAPLTRAEMARLSPAEVAELLLQFRVAVLGDDSVGACPAAWAGRLQRFIPSQFALFGFEAKLKVHPDVRYAVFLGCRPYPTSLGWRWGPTLGRRIYKHHWALKPQSSPFSWLRGVAHSELLAYPFVPLLREVNLHVMQHTEGQRWDPHSYLHHLEGLSRIDSARAARALPARATQETFDWCFHVYGFNRQDILEMEAALSFSPHLPVMLDCYAVRCVLEEDGC